METSEILMTRFPAS